MTPLRTAALVAAAAVLGAPAAGLAAQAASPDPAGPAAAHAAGRPTSNPLHWQPSSSEDASYAAREVCAQAIHVAVLFDREYVRTVSNYANGDPRVQDFSGPLTVRVTNLDDHRSAVEDLSAYGVFHYGRNGAITFDSYGPVGVAFRDGDGLPRGYYVLDGYHRVTIASDGTRRITRDRGAETNVCDRID